MEPSWQEPGTPGQSPGRLPPHLIPGAGSGCVLAVRRAPERETPRGAGASPWECVLGGGRARLLVRCGEAAGDVGLGAGGARGGQADLHTVRARARVGTRAVGEAQERAQSQPLGTCRTLHRACCLLSSGGWLGTGTAETAVRTRRPCDRVSVCGVVGVVVWERLCPHVGVGDSTRPCVSVTAPLALCVGECVFVSRFAWELWE